MFDVFVGISLIALLLLIFILLWRIKTSIDRCAINLEIIAIANNKKLPTEDKEFMEFIHNKNRIEAIKRYRKLTKSELKEADDFVNKLIKDEMIQDIKL